MCRNWISEIRNWWRRFRLHAFRPFPPTHIKWEIKMKTATILVTWKKSVSTDIKMQYLKLFLNVEEATEYALFPNVESFEFKADEGETVHIELVACDETFDSAAATLDFVVPDLEVPAAPTGLAWTITKVEDKLPEY